MKVKLNKNNLLFVAFVVFFSVITYLGLTNQTLLEQVIPLALENKFWLLGALILIKVVGLVWPPLPGGTFSIVAIPFIGWQWAYLADLIGSIIGASLCYAISHRWGKTILAKLLDEETIKKIESTNVKDGRQVEFSFLMTISSRLIMTEISYYAAGLLKVKFWKFLIGALASHFLIALPSYYFANYLFETNKVYLGIIGWIILIPLWLVIKKRYFVKT